MPSPADTEPEPGYAKVPGLPMMRYCLDCGAVVVNLKSHDSWHRFYPQGETDDLEDGDE